MTKIKQGQPGEMCPQVGQDLVAELAMRGEHRIDLSALYQIAQKARIVRRPQKTVQDENIGRQVGKLGQPGMIAAERRHDGHFPAAPDELAEQVQVEFVRPAHGQPRHDQQQPRLLLVEPILPRERIGDGFIRRERRGLGSGKLLPETRVALTHFFPKGGLALPAVPVVPAVAVVLAAAVPVEMLRQRRAPMALAGAVQPEVPVFQPARIVSS